MNTPVQIVLNRGRVGRGLFGFCSSTLNSVGERETFSVSSLFLINDDVFVFQISNFHDTILAVDS